jgi:hypothetical protein
MTDNISLGQKGELPSIDEKFKVTHFLFGGGGDTGIDEKWLRKNALCQHQIHDFHKKY